ncbi:MAG: Type IV secretory pathway VirB4 protein-like protein [Parcubacteria group bacterium GW2011_GWA2_47_7]|nr:MAG: Type IV secretory pathway VirB4 protein-like protein [Parcubacteria group bacterium GW2011_GWA2_47_7]
MSENKGFENLNTGVLPSDIFESTNLDMKDILAPAAVKITPKDIYIGDKIARTLFVISYPRFLSQDWFTPVINLDKVYDVSIMIHPVETELALRSFQKKVAEVQSQINERERKGFVRDPVLDVAYQDLEDLRDKLQQAQERLFDVGVYITVYANDRAELNKAESELKSILDAKLVYLKPAIFQQEQGYRSVLPLMTDELEVHYKLNSAPLSSIFPFVSFDLTSDKGILWGINRHNASLVLFDRFSMPNYNSVTFAVSGSGKSYTTKLEILRTLMFDADVIVIDPEQEYGFLAEATGGRYFNISLTSEHHINPFDLPPAREDETGADVLRSNIIFLVGLFRIMLGGLTPEEDSIESLLQRLEKYTRGTWSGFLNQPTNVDITKRFTVFSVRNMEDELKPVAVYIITHHIWTAIRKEMRKRLLVVDEAWWMMKSEDTASFLFGLAKRGRKYYLGIATITQDVNDFLRSPYGLPILTNSSIQILLKQSPTTIDLVQQTFHLTDEEKYLLLESGVGEGLFFAGLKHVAIKIYASYTEDQIVSSDPAQMLAIAKAKEELAAAQG